MSMWLYRHGYCRFNWFITIELKFKKR